MPKDALFLPKMENLKALELCPRTPLPTRLGLCP